MVDRNNFTGTGLMLNGENEEIQQILMRALEENS